MEMQRDGDMMTLKGVFRGENMPQKDQEITPAAEKSKCSWGQQLLLRVAGAAAALIASLDSKRLPVGAVEAADVVATSINQLSEGNPAGRT